MDLKEVLVGMVMPMVKAVGKMEVAELLGKVKAKNTPETYGEVLKTLHSSFTLLKGVAADTKTTIDDGIVSLILESVEEAGAKDGVTF